MQDSHLLILNSLDQKRAFTQGDPRLATRFNDYINLVGAPKISAKTPLRPGQFGGDIIYYLDPQINVPFPAAVYGTSIGVSLTTAPYTNLKNMIIPQAIIKPDMSIKNSDLRRQIAGRNDLMAAQQSNENRLRPLFF